MAAARQRAPKPLSILTTDTPSAQVFRIASREAQHRALYCADRFASPASHPIGALPCSTLAQSRHNRRDNHGQRTRANGDDRYQQIVDRITIVAICGDGRITKPNPERDETGGLFLRFPRCLAAMHGA